MQFSSARKMQTVDITYAGQTVALPDSPNTRRFMRV